MNIEHGRVEGKVVINRKRRDWELLVKECEGSGKSWKEFCAEKGLCLASIKVDFPPYFLRSGQR